MKINIFILLLSINCYSCNGQFDQNKSSSLDTLYNLITSRPKEPETCKIISEYCEQLFFTKIPFKLENAIIAYINSDTSKITSIVYDGRNFCNVINSYLLALMHSKEFIGLSKFEISKKLLSTQYTPIDASIKTIYLSSAINSLAKQEIDSLLYEFSDSEESIIEILDLYFDSSKSNELLNYFVNNRNSIKNAKYKVYRYICFQLMRRSEFDASLSNRVKEFLKNEVNNANMTDSILYNEIIKFTAEK